MRGDGKYLLTHYTGRLEVHHERILPLDSGVLQLTHLHITVLSTFSELNFSHLVALNSS